VAVALYIGLTGFAQPQPARINFVPPSKQATSEKITETDLIASDKKNQELSALAEKLNSLMQEDRLFLHPDLDLQELSQHLQTSSARVSATINQIFEQNFNDYINSLRIEEFIRLYRLNHHKYTLLSLAFDSGFNSKATFNRAFKKIKGMSPKEYFHKHPGQAPQKA
jgi:AraC-like DNA-binding protein